MTTTTNHTSELDTWLPDQQVVEDVRRIVQAESQGQLEFDSGTTTVPSGTAYEVVSKAFIKQPSNIGFGSCFRAVVAIGEVAEANGILKSEFGFATAWYSDSGNLITTDFSEVTPV
ncbi:MAG: hypothetical protein OSA88_11810 [Acidimicrobiales bacterium]|nr:hypothetical protein [Acidimicrobiales bacterium]